MLKLSGKNAFITGGATGIGLAIAKALAGQGARVVITGRREDKLREASRGWQHEPVIVYRRLDVTDRQEVMEVVRWAVEDLGSIDILVNAAGVNFPKRTMADMPPETWDQTVAINATGAYNVIAAVLPAMRKRRDGLIVNICSVAGKRASMLGGVAYSASKFAMHALGTAVALEEGKNGVRVTNVSPGEVDTPILDGRPTPVTPEHRARILQAEDVAEAVLMVACLPPRAHVADLVIKPVWQDYA